MGIAIALIGMWIFSDSIYSYTLYVNAPSYDGTPKQSWRQDHWVRAVRSALGVTLIVLGTKLAM